MNSASKASAILRDSSCDGSSLKGLTSRINKSSQHLHRCVYCVNLYFIYCLQTHPPRISADQLCLYGIRRFCVRLQVIPCLFPIDADGHLYIIFSFRHSFALHLHCSMVEILGMISSSSFSSGRFSFISVLPANTLSGL